MLDPQSDERLLAEETDCLLMGPTERKDSLAQSTSNFLSFGEIFIQLKYNQEIKILRRGTINLKLFNFFEEFSFN